jgi:hypothetical protein
MLPTSSDEGKRGSSGWKRKDMGREKSSRHLLRNEIRKEGEI